MTATISINGFMSSPAAIMAWTQSRHEVLRQAVKVEMARAQTALKGDVSAAIASSFRVQRSSFPKAWRTRVYAEKQKSLPALLVQAKIFWMGIQEQGGVLARGRGYLIPFGKLRIGWKAFRSLILDIMHAKAGFFRVVNGKVILFAKVKKFGSKAGNRLRRAEAQRQGKKRLSTSEAVPIATLVKRIVLKPRYNLSRVVQSEVARIARAIETRVVF